MCYMVECPGVLLLGVILLYGRMPGGTFAGGHSTMAHRRKRLNAAVCRARKIVEQSFGDTK